jgi:hypothetical protein
MVMLKAPNLAPDIEEVNSWVTSEFIFL